MKSFVLAAALAVIALTSQSACKASEASCSAADQCLPDVGYEDMIAKTKIPRAQLQGKVVVVNFWATWCPPCKAEIPAFNRVYSKYKDRGVVFLGVLSDNTVDEAGALNFMSDHEFTYPVVRADQSVMVAYQAPNALPTTFIYDKRGRILTTPHRGPMTEQQLTAALEMALAGK